MPLDPELQPLLAVVAAGEPLYRLTPVEARAAFRVMTVDMRPADQITPVASVEEITVPGAAGPLPARVYRPEAEGLQPIVVFFHGGGFVIGDLDTHDNMARQICAGTRAVVVSVDYRLAPESVWPAAAEDAITVTRAILSDPSPYGGSNRVGVAGDSAGGNLAAVVAQQVPGLVAQFLIYPATDVAGDYASRIENAEGYMLDMPTMAWFIGQYAPDPASHDDPLLSPMRGDLTGLPPAVVITAEFDPLRDEGEAYAAAMTAAGVPVVQRRFDGVIHGFMDMGPFSVACRDATSESISMFDKILSRLA